MNKVTVSAPGKLMLFGEHAVVYNRPCIVTAVNQRMWVTVEVLEELFFVLDAPDVRVNDYKKPLSKLGKSDIPKGAIFVEITVKNFIKKYPIKKGIKISTASEFSSAFGFGSSSAVTVCVLKALSELFKIKLTNKELFDLAYKTVLDIQGKGSGFDVAAAIYGGILYFVTGGKVIEPLNVESLPLLVGYSGVKADTTAIIQKISRQEGNQLIYSQIGKLVNQAKNALLQSDWKTVGILMNKNQEFLKKLGVSTKKLDTMIAVAREAGAYGAKLSGAGGGDCMIALVDENKKHTVMQALEKVGGKVIDVQANAERVRIES